MRVLFLGTSAAEWYPAPWCNCEHCSEARRHGAEDLRALSSVAILPDVLIDVPPDLPLSASRFGFSLAGVRLILVTHPHGDHLDPRILVMRRPPSRVDSSPVGPRVTEVREAVLCASKGTIEYIEESLPMPPSELRLRLVPLSPFEWREPLEGVRVLPLPANHMRDAGHAFIYVVEREGKRMLYAVDTGPLSGEALEALCEIKLDLAVCEATLGSLRPSQPLQHMSVSDVESLRRELVSRGAVSEETPFVLTHVSPHGLPPHHIAAEQLRERGLILAHDGLVVEV
ncbi:MAG: hypothetical protein DRJ56_03135 [Thermoprotei archaeon]|nr:MAG: hypothetical protein DRJ56_03135 [Thermoprotei archaeon]